MTNPTSNFGWQMPTATDLVTDLPADFEVFGQAVDTDLAGLKVGTTGQVLAKASGTDLDFVWSADAAGMANPMTTTADIIYSSSGSTPARLGIGTASQVLAVNSGATAPEWTTVSSGGMTLLSTTSLSGASTTISSISGSYKNLQLVIQNVLPSTQAGMVMRFNSDSGTNYMNKDTTISGTSSTYNETYNKISSDQHTSGTNLSVTNIYDYANSTTRKLSQSLAISQNNGTPNFNLSDTRGSWNDTSAITSITLLFYTGTISSGTALLYGVS